jgi:ketosteroid isomerase-like protein
MTTTTTTNQKASSPSVVEAWFAAHEGQQTDAELTTMTDDVVIIDQDETYRGLEAARGWISGSSREFTYTTTVLASASDGNATVVTARLEGDFPGGRADLSYRFVLAGDRISALTIS